MSEVATQLNFFNTCHLTGEALAEMIAQCNRQEGRILEIMADGRQYTPLEIHAIYNSMYPPVPESSIRRAITCLTKNQKYLVKCDRMKEEKYGMKNHYWSIKRNNDPVN